MLALRGDRIGRVEDGLAGAVPRARRLDHIDRRVALDGQHQHLAELRGVGETSHAHAGMRVREPRQLARVTRSHRHFMLVLRESGCERLADVAGSKDSNFHGHSPPR
jgi:hypothetical protein